ncbi:metal-sensitive transcriptional regulator [Leptospira idonii]|uniref:Transcriptional regulator n=1 Tax=Leptospira idonii TaxID=1193500 RepID=A0A4R9M1D3_9LEPT|nr:metal-sensitive transcriptional regulator [Leptospira idonii]TGN19635.1 transcriptional regulator [Leptospira idonii]
MDQSTIASKKIQDRLARLEGHLKSVRNMVAEGKPCNDVIHQIAAVQAALSKVAKLLIEDHFSHCILAQTKDPELTEDLKEFMSSIDNYFRTIH